MIWPIDVTSGEIISLLETAQKWFSCGDAQFLFGLIWCNILLTQLYAFFILLLTYVGDEAC